MRQSIAIISLLSSAVVAADTISFYFPGGTEGVDPVASIEKADATTTVFNIACPSNVAGSECGWGPGLDYTIISQTHYEAHLSAASVSLSFACDHNTLASQMTCTVSMAGGALDDASPQTAVLDADQFSFTHATIVAGANLLATASAHASPAATPSPAVSTPAATRSPARSAASSALQSATGSAAPAQHTGAASQLDFQASALLVVVGAVAAAAL
ncbi:hypothetical protein ACEQ8H_005118 [Pleosporales sp. CAS-2024a]